MHSASLQSPQEATHLSRFSRQEDLELNYIIIILYYINVSHINRK